MCLKKEIENLLSSFQIVKSQIKLENPEWYESWKSGGFLIDSNIVSYYPNIEGYFDLSKEDDEFEEE